MIDEGKHSGICVENGLSRVMCRWTWFSGEAKVGTLSVVLPAASRYFELRVRDIKVRPYVTPMLMATES